MPLQPLGPWALARGAGQALQDSRRTWLWVPGRMETPATSDFSLEPPEWQACSPIFNLTKIDQKHHNTSVPKRLKFDGARLAVRPASKNHRRIGSGAGVGNLDNRVRTN